MPCGRHPPQANDPAILVGAPNSAASPRAPSMSSLQIVAALGRAHSQAEAEAVLDCSDAGLLWTTSYSTARRLTLKPSDRSLSIISLREELMFRFAGIMLAATVLSATVAAEAQMAATVPRPPPVMVLPPAVIVPPPMQPALPHPQPAPVRAGDGEAPQARQSSITPLTPSPSSRSSSPP